MTVIHFEPLDTLFFRDGRPYNRGEQNQSGVASLFPPAPSVLVGAVRAACARIMGWQHGTWNERISACLGNGNDLGPLCFRGPLLMHRGEAVYPAPANLVASLPQTTKSTPNVSTLLSPSKAGMICDLGSDVQLPVMGRAIEGAKLLGDEGWWITKRGLEMLLESRPPDSGTLIHNRKLWQMEARVGNIRSEETRTTDEGALYSPSHVRLCRGSLLAVEVDGLPNECVDALPGQPSPVGGEARACWLRPTSDTLPMPNPVALLADGDRLRYTVIVVTPADTKTPPRLGEEFFAGLPGRIISACLPRPALIGGWDSQTMQPIAVRPHLPVGSVLYLETTKDKVGAVEALHGSSIGHRTEWGFGVIAVGRWNYEPDQT